MLFFPYEKEINWGIAKIHCIFHTTCIIWTESITLNLKIIIFSKVAANLQLFRKSKITAQCTAVICYRHSKCKRKTESIHKTIRKQPNNVVNFIILQVTDRTGLQGPRLRANAKAKTSKINNTIMLYWNFILWNS